jgi:hypothetical protein
MADRDLIALVDKCENVARESGAYESYRAVRESFAELRQAISRPKADERGSAEPHPPWCSGGCCNPDSAQARDAEEALLKVLAAVQKYLPPDGTPIKDAMSEIISIVDPWPLKGGAAS